MTSFTAPSAIARSVRTLRATALLLGSLVATVLLTLPAATQAEQMSDIVQLQILDGGATKRGTQMGALRLTLSQGWKTYWRAPGDAGIPPQFSWKGSRNIASVSIKWPTPDVFLTSGFRTIGYHDQLVLPVEITPANPGQPVRLKGRMQLGICNDICVPAELRFDQDLKPGSRRNPAIVAALADRPLSAKEAGVRTASCDLKPSRYGMELTAHITMPPAGGQEVVVIEPGAPTLATTETTTKRQGNQLTARTEIISADGGPFAVDRSQMRFTVLGSNRAVDIHGCTRH
ncbi:protein-disulfide reductase DsbD domain-containing protein [Phaeobacter porticola]|uniref:Disulfide bond corrector protein DsbC n=1 Tax=Phaeobacter porticola TaxID=1844006 RepID=A0A1L3I8S5_9RHOB|nr:protein-disulfide reductase DsbD domain-containing protein [Phaeobacter porticola]APG48423.1 disulfide bond corrector protein DsbC [Phaeobacter porticola]